MTAPPRVVLDTNVVLSALSFGRGWPGRIRHGWQSLCFVPLASTVTVQELVRALAYPKFGLSDGDRQELLADYVPWLQVVRIAGPPPETPACRDMFDAPFLQLAIAGRARALVSGDRDLLALDGAPGLCPVLGLEAFGRRFLGA